MPNKLELQLLFEKNELLNILLKLLHTYGCFMCVRWRLLSCWMQSDHKPLASSFPVYTCSRVTLKQVVVGVSLIDWLIELGLTSHQTHYRSYRGWVFTGQMTHPRVSKHWRKIGPKDLASIPSGPPHRAHIDTTAMQYETKKTQIHTNTNKSTHSEMGPVRQNPIQKTVRTAHLSVLMTVRNFSTQYNTEQFW